MAKPTYYIPGSDGKPRAVSEQQYEQHWNGVFAADPVLQQLQASRVTAYKGWSPYKDTPQAKAHREAVDQRMKQLGFTDSSTDHDMGFKFQNGRYEATRGSFIDRNTKEIGIAVIGAAIGGPFAAAALAGGAAPAAGAATGGTTAAGTGTYGAAGVTGADIAGGAAGPLGSGATTSTAIGGTTAAGAGAGKAATSFFTSPEFIAMATGTGSDLFKTWMGNRARDRALGTQTAAADKSIALKEKALAERKQIYEESKGAYQPYMSAGTGALGLLTGLSGIPMGGGGGGTPPPPQDMVPLPGGPAAFAPGVTEEAPGSRLGPPRAPGSPLPSGPPPPPRQPLSQVNNMSASSYGSAGERPVRAPNGQVYMVPEDRLHEAEANGGQVL